MDILALTTGHYLEETEEIMSAEHPATLRAARSQVLFLVPHHLPLHQDSRIKRHEQNGWEREEACNGIPRGWTPVLSTGYGSELLSALSRALSWREIIGGVLKLSC